MNERLEDIYHEMVTLEMDKRILAKTGLRAGIDYMVKNVDVPDYDYSNNPQWVAQKKISNKAYKDLKIMEFNIRHK